MEIQITAKKSSFEPEEPSIHDLYMVKDNSVQNILLPSHELQLISASDLFFADPSSPDSNHQQSRKQIQVFNPSQTNLRMPPQRSKRPYESSIRLDRTNQFSFPHMTKGSYSKLHHRSKTNINSILRHIGASNHNQSTNVSPSQQSLISHTGLNNSPSATLNPVPSFKGPSFDAPSPTNRRKTKSYLTRGNGHQFKPTQEVTKKLQLEFLAKQVHPSVSQEQLLKIKEQSPVDVLRQVDTGLPTKGFNKRFKIRSRYLSMYRQDNPISEEQPPQQVTSGEWEPSSVLEHSKSKAPMRAIDSNESLEEVVSGQEEENDATGHISDLKLGKPKISDSSQCRTISQLKKSTLGKSEQAETRVDSSEAFFPSGRVSPDPHNQTKDLFLLTKIKNLKSNLRNEVPSTDKGERDQASQVAVVLSSIKAGRHDALATTGYFYPKCKTSLLDKNQTFMVPEVIKEIKEQKEFDLLGQGHVTGMTNHGATLPSVDEGGASIPQILMQQTFRPSLEQKMGLNATEESVHHQSPSKSNFSKMERYDSKLPHISGRPSFKNDNSSLTSGMFLSPNQYAFPEVVPNLNIERLKMRNAMAQQAEEVETSMTHFDNYSLLPNQIGSAQLEADDPSPSEEQQIMLPNPPKWEDTSPRAGGSFPVGPRIGEFYASPSFKKKQRGLKFFEEKFSEIIHLNRTLRPNRSPLPIDWERPIHKFKTDQFNNFEYPQHGDRRVQNSPTKRPQVKPVDDKWTKKEEQEQIETLIQSVEERVEKEKAAEEQKKLPAINLRKVHIKRIMKNFEFGKETLNIFGDLNKQLYEEIKPKERKILGRSKTVIRNTGRLGHDVGEAAEGTARKQGSVRFDRKMYYKLATDLRRMVD